MPALRRHFMTRVLLLLLASLIYKEVNPSLIRESLSDSVLSAVRVLARTWVWGHGLYLYLLGV